MEPASNQLVPDGVNRQLRVKRARPIRSTLLTIIAGGIISAILAYVVGSYYPEIKFEQSFAAFLSIAFLAASTEVAYDWYKSESLRKPMDETNPVHKEFRLWIIRVLLIAIYMVTAGILILFSLGLRRDLLIVSAEIGVLMVTIAFIILCSKYSATSLTVDVNQLIREFRASNESLTNIYQKASDELTGTFNSNTTKLLSKLDEQGLKQSTIL